MTDAPASVIWATRGRSWGFRFLRDGGLADPLTAYEAAFRGIRESEGALVPRESVVALRLVDPEGRRDAAGRPIVHDFVIPRSQAVDVQTIDSGLRMIWAPLAAEYDRVWDAAAPPSPRSTE